MLLGRAEKIEEGLVILATECLQTECLLWMSRIIEKPCEGKETMEKLRLATHMELFGGTDGQDRITLCQAVKKGSCDILAFVQMFGCHVAMRDIGALEGRKEGISK
jgi:hypothetical protein